MTFWTCLCKSCCSSTVRQFFVATVACIGVFSLGTVLAWTSPALPEFERRDPFGNGSISDEEKSWIASIAMLGALVASPIAGFSVDFLGRRNSMMIFSTPFILGWILIAYATEYKLLLAGRFITGFFGGAFSLAAPIYISETAGNNIRGTLASIFQLMLVLGILFTYVVGSFVSWRNLAFISGVIPGIALVLLPFIPATPRYLLSVKKPADARKSLEWLRGPGPMNPEDVEMEIFEIEQGIQDEAAEESISFKDFFRTKSYLLKPILVCLSLMIFEQISGYNAIIFFTEGIFDAAGTSMDSNISSIICGVVQVVATVVSTVLVDRAGRRSLLLIPQLVMAVSLVALGIFFVLKGDDAEHESSYLAYLKWLPLTCMLVFIVAFSIGIGPLSWTMMGEILPPNVKGVTSSIATSLVWLGAFVVTKTFDDIANALGIFWCFFIFAICCVIGYISIYFTVPETKGKSLEEIQALFKKSVGNPSMSNRLP